MCEFFKSISAEEEEKCENCLYYDFADYYGCPADWVEKQVISEE